LPNAGLKSNAHKSKKIKNNFNSLIFNSLSLIDFFSFNRNKSYVLKSNVLFNLAFVKINCQAISKEYGERIKLCGEN